MDSIEAPLSSVLVVCGQNSANWLSASSIPREVRNTNFISTKPGIGNLAHPCRRMKCLPVLLFADALDPHLGRRERGRVGEEAVSRKIIIFMAQNGQADRQRDFMGSTHDRHFRRDGEGRVESGYCRRGQTRARSALSGPSSSPIICEIESARAGQSSVAPPAPTRSCPATLQHLCSPFALVGLIFPGRGAIWVSGDGMGWLGVGGAWPRR